MLLWLFLFIWYIQFIGKLVNMTCRNFEQNLIKHKLCAYDFLTVDSFVLFLTAGWSFKMEVDNPSPRCGYNSKLFNDQQAIQKYICTICNNVLKNAVQIPQSADPRRACHDCYNSNIRYVHFFLFKEKPSSKILTSVQLICLFEIKFHDILKVAPVLEKIFRKKSKKIQANFGKSKKLWNLLLKFSGFNKN